MSVSANAFIFLIEHGEFDADLRKIARAALDRAVLLGQVVPVPPRQATAQATVQPEAQATVQATVQPRAKRKVQSKVQGKVQGPSTRVFHAPVNLPIQPCSSSIRDSQRLEVFGQVYDKCDLVGYWFYRSTKEGVIEKCVITGVGSKALKYSPVNKDDDQANFNVSKFLPLTTIAKWFEV